jgi:hypothetical protein
MGVLRQTQRRKSITTLRGQSSPGSTFIASSQVLFEVIQSLAESPVGLNVVGQAANPVPVLALALAIATTGEGQVEVLMSITEGLHMSFHSGV